MNGQVMFQQLPNPAQPRVAWIIGGGSGIGAEVALLLARRGWTVVISGRRAERLEQVARQHGGIHAHPLDVTNSGAVSAAVERISSERDRIDLFVFGAAAWSAEKTSDYGLAGFEKVVDTNFVGFVRFIEPLVRQMEQQGGGQIAAIASVAGYFGLPRSAAYSATKAALITLLQTMRTELAASRIDVRLIAPGFVKSELTAANDFPMPFLMETDAAARRIVDGLTRCKRFEIAFPRRLVWPMKLIRLLPYPLFFWIMRQLPKKQ
jgi:NAD(P)-dependent dehydrogenase (short-subunit alcohol dehydrogenase family)